MLSNISFSAYAWLGLELKSSVMNKDFFTSNRNTQVIIDMTNGVVKYGEL